MNRLFALVSVLALVLCTGCGDSHESMAEDSLATTKELVAVFDTVKDEASAKSAKPKLKSLMEKMNDINARQAKLPMPTEAEFKAMEAKYGKEMEELQQKMVSHMLRIGFDPKIRAVLDDIEMKKP